MEPLDYLRLLKRRWWLIASTLVLALAAAYVSLPSGAAASQPLAKSYTATHTLLQAPDVATPINLDLTKLFTTTGEIPRKAAERLQMPPEQGPVLAAQVAVTIDKTVSAFKISVTSSDGERAASIANAFAVEVLEFLRSSAEADRNTEAGNLQSQLNTLQEKVLAVQTALSSAGARAPLLEAERSAFTARYQATFARLQELQDQGPARAPLTTLQEAVPVPVIAAGSPVPTSRSGRLGLAGVLGLLLGVGLVLAIDRLDTRIRSREQAEDASQLAVIAEIPRLERSQRRRQEVVTAAAPGGAVAEAYRALRSSLLLVPSRPIPLGDAPQTFSVEDWKPPRVVLVTSASPSDGKTSTVVNLAATLAESGRSVIILDADFRKPAANRFLGVPRSAGLSELLSGGVQGGVRSVLRDTGVPGVQLVTSGSSSRHPAALLSRLGVVVKEAKRLADVVIIDSAPLLVANDGTDIVPHVDTVLVVQHASKTTRPQAERTSELLARLGVPVLGVILQGSREAVGVVDGYYGAAPEKGRLRSYGSSAASRRQHAAASASATVEETPDTPPTPRRNPPATPRSKETDEVHP